MITFRKTKQENGYLSNMCSGFPITIFDRQFKTIQHLYQCMKFNDGQIQIKIWQTKSPIVAKLVSRQYNNKVREDWQQISVDAMALCIQLKFTQHSGALYKLMNTGDKYIMEYDSKYKSFWGNTPNNGTGLNMLGLILMNFRTIARDGGIEFNNNKIDDSFIVNLFDKKYIINKSNNIYQIIKEGKQWV